MKKFLCLIVIIVLSAFAARGDDGKKIATLNDLKINDIIADPEGNLYLATEYGGFYISTDEGATWKLTNSLTKKYNITCILYDDFEGLFCSTMDRAFIQTTDQGTTWRIRNGISPTNFIIKTKRKFKIYLAIEYFDSQYPYYIYNLSIDNYMNESFGYFKLEKLFFTKDGTLYGCGNGVIRHDDIDNYNKISWVDLTNSLNIYSYCMASDNNSRLYAGTEKGVYYTDNKAERWDVLSTEIEKYRITSLFIDKNDRIIAGTDSSGIFISDDKGITWKTVKQPFENIKIKKFYEFKSNTLFSIAGKNLYKSTNNGDTWVNLNSPVYTVADSLEADGWMPSINYFDFHPMIGELSYIKIVNNDSLIVVQGNNQYLRLYDFKSGHLVDKFRFPDSLKVEIFHFVNKDTAILITRLNYDYNFGIYTRKDSSYKIYFTLNNSYFEEQYPRVYKFQEIDFGNLFTGKNTKIFNFSYTIKGIRQHPGENYWEYRFESRYLEDGKLLKSSKEVISASEDRNYYLSNHIKLFNSNDDLIYDITKIPENKEFINNDSISYSIISPNNKYILSSLWEKNKLLIADFQSGKVLRELNQDCYNFGFFYDDNYFFSSSYHAAVQINNINDSNGPFDGIIWNGNGPWIIAKAKKSMNVVFGCFEAILRLWKPDMNLTSVEEKPEPEPELINNLIFPNPAEDYIEIKNPSEGWQPSEGSAIRIFNSIGQCVTNVAANVETHGRASLRIDISALHPGIYFLRLGGQYAKFVKMR